MPARKERVIQSGSHAAGTKLTVTRKGVEVFAWYCGHGCGDPIEVGWDELARLREEVETPTPRPLQKESLF